MFTPENLKFDDNYKVFLEHLTEKEFIQFEHAAKELTLKQELLYKKFNEIVSERISKAIIIEDINALMKKQLSMPNAKLFYEGLYSCGFINNENKAVLDEAYNNLFKKGI